MLACVSLLFLGSGCFWWSSAPNFKVDPLTEVVVIWDRPQSTKAIELATWATTNSVRLGQLAAGLDTASWESRTTLLASHPTRILLVTRSGAVWETHILGKDRLSLFVLRDPVRSGVIKGKTRFLAALTLMMEADTGRDVDLEAADFEERLYRKEVAREIPDSTVAQLRRFRRASAYVQAHPA